MFELMTIGIVPVITHPERLTWVEDHHDTFVRLAGRGAWMQVTAGALTGRFGRRVKYWGDKFVGEGHCHILATDAHHPQRRPPLLAEAREAADVTARPTGFRALPPTGARGAAACRCPG